jgi:hypothetical protein
VTETPEKKAQRLAEVQAHEARMKQIEEEKRQRLKAQQEAAAERQVKA